MQRAGPGFLAGSPADGIVRGFDLIAAGLRRDAMSVF
jgi:hypothetical protein